MHKGNQVTPIKRQLEAILEAFKTTSEFKSTQVIVDVDPM
jgi:hypothetical protein